MIDFAATQFAGVAAVAQHDDTIGQILHLGQPMRDIDDAHTGCFEFVNDAE